MTNPAATSMAGMQMGAGAGKSMSAGGIKAIPTQTLGTANWQGMKIQARAMTAVPFVIYDGTHERLVRPPKRVSFHLMVDLDDARTGVAIPYAGVWATITRQARTVYDERQWPMISEYMGPHYGNNVALPGRGKLPAVAADQPAGLRAPRRVPQRLAQAAPSDDDVQLEAVVTPDAAMTMGLGGAGHAMPLVSEWLGIAGAAVFVVIAASHLRHLTTATGQRRPWHACHVLIAVGMAFMYAPAAIDPFVIPAGFWRVVFALACVLAALWSMGGVQRAPTLMWLLTAVDLGAMVCMWTTNLSASLCWALVVYLGVQASLWALDAYRRVDGGAPVINVAAPVGRSGWRRVAGRRRARGVAARRP